MVGCDKTEELLVYICEPHNFCCEDVGISVSFSDTNYSTYVSFWFIFVTPAT